MQVRNLRGRFYLEWRWDPVDQPEAVSSCGRITPQQEPPGELLLEAPYGQAQWSRVGTGSPERLITVVAGDGKGTFHGLGALDKSLQHAAKAGLGRTPRGRTQVWQVRLYRTQAGHALFRKPSITFSGCPFTSSRNPAAGIPATGHLG